MSNFKNPKLTIPGNTAGREQLAGANSTRELFEVFTPTRPAQDASTFVGRRDILRKIVDGIEEENAHIVIYGDGGVGKTSLANILAQDAKEAGYHIFRYTCNSDTSFEDIFRSLMKSLPAKLIDRSSRGQGPNFDSFDQLLPSGIFSSTDVTRALEHLFEPTIFIIDEFERVTSDQVKRKLAETIKSSSDGSGVVTFIIVGIAQSLEELIGEHPSTQRQLRFVHLPLLKKEDLCEFISRSQDQLDIAFDDYSRDLIVSASKGSPYCAHLMGLYAGRRALNRDSKTVEVCDVRDTFQAIVDLAEPSMVEQYEMQTSGESNALTKDVLFAAALSCHGSHGTFTVTEAKKAFEKSVGTAIAELTMEPEFNRLSEIQNRPILKNIRLPSGETTYKFSNPRMRQYILLRQTEERAIVSCLAERA